MHSFTVCAIIAITVLIGVFYVVVNTIRDESQGLPPLNPGADLSLDFRGVEPTTCKTGYYVSNGKCCKIGLVNTNGKCVKKDSSSNANANAVEKPPPPTTKPTYIPAVAVDPNSNPWDNIPVFNSSNSNQPKPATVSDANLPVANVVPNNLIKPSTPGRQGLNSNLGVALGSTGSSSSSSGGGSSGSSSGGSSGSSSSSGGSSSKGISAESSNAAAVLASSIIISLLQDAKKKGQTWNQVMSAYGPSISKLPQDVIFNLHKNYIEA